MYAHLHAYTYIIGAQYNIIVDLVGKQYDLFFDMGINRGPTCEPKSNLGTDMGKPFAWPLGRRVWFFSLISRGSVTPNDAAVIK